MIPPPPPPLPSSNSNLDVDPPTVPPSPPIPPSLPIPSPSYLPPIPPAPQSTLVSLPVASKISPAKLRYKKIWFSPDILSYKYFCFALLWTSKPYLCKIDLEDAEMTKKLKRIQSQLLLRPLRGWKTFFQVKIWFKLQLKLKKWHYIFISRVCVMYVSSF